MIGEQVLDQRVEITKCPDRRKYDLLLRRKVNLDLGLKLLGNLRLPVCQLGVVNRHGALDPHT